MQSASCSLDLKALRSLIASIWMSTISRWFTDDRTFETTSSSRCYFRYNSEMATTYPIRNSSRARARSSSKFAAVSGQRRGLDYSGVMVPRRISQAFGSVVSPNFTSQPSAKVLGAIFYSQVHFLSLDSYRTPVHSLYCI